MTLGKLDRRTALVLIAGIGGVLAIRFGFYGDSAAPAVVSGAMTVPMAEQRLARLRQAAATVPGKEILLRQVSAELAAREKGLIPADTAAQAQAQLLETIRRVAQHNGIETRGAEDMRIRPLSPDYGEAFVAVSFNCHIDQLVNLLADLANEPTLLATNEIRVSSANPKDKTVSVRLGLSGVVPRKLVQERKGEAAF